MAAWRALFEKDDGAVLEVWNDGPNACLGVVSDEMHKLVEGGYDRIVITAGEIPERITGPTTTHTIS